MKDEKLDAIDLKILALIQKDSSMNNVTLAKMVETSPPTCLRRVRRLRDMGVIEKQIALIRPEKLFDLLGKGITVIVEVSLSRQDAFTKSAFEARILNESCVQQCYQISHGFDFIIILHTVDVKTYYGLAQRLFTPDLNICSLKAFVSVKRCKFNTQVGFDFQV